MINIAICDDIVEERESIYSYVENKFKELGLSFKISSFNDGQDLIEHMNSSKEVYDIIFLDIYMEFSDGINIARKIREFDKGCKIIFITSSKEHAVDSYDVSAFNYVLKPVNEEKLNNVIKMAIEALNRDNKETIIKNKKGIYRILYKDILYAESKARIINIYLKSGDIISFYSKLEDFYQSLQDERFLKCHKSFLVNMDYILKIENNNIFIINGINIPISSTNSSKIRENYFNYLLK